MCKLKRFLGIAICIQFSHFSICVFLIFLYFSHYIFFAFLQLICHNGHFVFHFMMLFRKFFFNSLTFFILHLHGVGFVISCNRDAKLRGGV